MSRKSDVDNTENKGQKNRGNPSKMEEGKDEASGKQYKTQKQERLSDALKDNLQRRKKKKN